MRSIIAFEKKLFPLVGLAILLALFASAQQRPQFNDGEPHGDPPFLIEDGWKPLLNGKDLSGWRGQAGQPHEWFTTQAIRWERLLGPTRLIATPAPGGRMLNGSGRTANLVSEEKHGDVELYLEFMISKGSNSGVYLQGLYEVQIFDSWGSDAAMKTSDGGAIYHRWINNQGVGGSAPKVNASRRPGEWQSYQIWFRAPRFDAAGKKSENARFVRVLHNGVLVQEDVELDGGTRAHMPHDEAPLNPLMLQGDHGPVAFKDIYWRPLREIIVRLGQRWKRGRRPGGRRCGRGRPHHPPRAILPPDPPCYPLFLGAPRAPACRGWAVQPYFDDPQLGPIAGKVLAGERLSYDDGLALYRSGDLLGIGYLANLIRERLNGNTTYFNVNRHINPTDVCVAACKLCAFGKQARDLKAYTMSLDQVWHTAGQGYVEAVSEFHIVGGLHPELTLDWYCEMISGLRERYPHVHLKAFTMVEVGYLARRAKLSIEETLIKLKDAGVQSLPGGGAEIFSERVRRIICDHKIDGEEWLNTARIAHGLGLKSNATMLYGHVETEEDRVDHLLKLRALQDETGGFQTFIPLAFHPANTAMHHLPPTTGFADIKNIAISRLLLDNFPHIKAYWIMMTPKVAQVAQRFGADDLDGTVVEEKIYHDAGATTSQALRREELLRLIRHAGRDPVERDTLYRPVSRSEATLTVLA